MTLSAGTRLGPYEMLAPLGEGGMGEVYRARDTRLDRPVAIKTLHAEGARAWVALSLGLTFVTNNSRHFQRVAGLKTANWA